MPASNESGRGEKGEATASDSKSSTHDSVSVESISEIDGFRVLGLSADDVEFYTGFSPERRKRVVRKVSGILTPPQNVARTSH